MKATGKGYQSETDIKGKPQPVPGLYHVTIPHVNDSRTKKDGSALNATIVEMEVLAGSVPGQEGKTITAFFNLGENGEETAEYCEKISRLCLSAGIIKPGDPDRDVQAEELENCQVVVKWEAYTSKSGKQGCSIGNFGLDIWGVNHPDVASVPKNLDAIRIWNEARGVSSDGNGHAAGGNGNGQAAATVGAGVNTDDI